MYPGDADVGFGNRSTINAWIGAHLVVADPAARLVYVCEPHHGLGRAMVIGIDGPVDLAPLPAAEDDLALHAQAAAPFDAGLKRMRDLIEQGDLATARQEFTALQALNPNHFSVYEIAAHLASDPKTRREHLQRALDLAPAYPADEARIRAALAEVEEGAGDQTAVGADNNK